MSACPLCREGRARIPRGSAFVHLGDVGSTIVGCGEQPGYDPEAFNRAVDAVVAAVEPWEPQTATEVYGVIMGTCERDHMHTYWPNGHTENDFCVNWKPFDYEPPSVYSYSACPVCGALVLPGDDTSGQMHGRPLHARCMAEYTADLDGYDDRTGER